MLYCDGVASTTMSARAMWQVNGWMPNRWISTYDEYYCRDGVIGDDTFNYEITCAPGDVVHLEGNSNDWDCCQDGSHFSVGDDSRSYAWSGNISPSSSQPWVAEGVWPGIGLQELTWEVHDLGLVGAVDPDAVLTIIVNIKPLSALGYRPHQCDPCSKLGTSCASCPSSNGVDIPRPNLNSYGVDSGSFRYFIPVIERIVEVDTAKRTISANETKYTGDMTIYYSDWRGRVWDLSIPDLPVPDAQNPAESLYPVIYGWNINDEATVIRYQGSVDGDISYVVERKDGRRSVYQIDSVPQPPYWVTVAYPKNIYGPGGEEFSMTTGVGGVCPLDFRDQYGNTRSIHQYSSNAMLVNNSDGTYSIITYPGSDSVGCSITELSQANPSRIEVFNSDSVLLSRIDYSYDQDGRLATAQKGDRLVEFTYNDTDHCITVTEMSAIPNIQTIYHYGSSGQAVPGQPAANETWVIQKQSADYSVNVEPGDRKSVYVFATQVLEGGSVINTDIIQVTDPEGNVTHYDRTGSGNITSIDDPNHLITGINYNSTGAVDDVHLSRSSQPLGAVDYTYYNNASGNATSWLKTFKDVRGNYIHFARNDMLNCPWKVDEVKISPLDASGNPPATEPDWSGIAPTRQYEYYGDVENITSTATLTWDDGHEYYPGITPENLRDGEIGEGHQDVGCWDYSLPEPASTPYYSNDYFWGNASYWEWTEKKSLKSINLFVDLNTQNFTVPQSVKIYAKDGDGNYSIPVYCTKYGEVEPWTNGELHITPSISTTGLKVVYGNYDVYPQLDEVTIFAATSSPDGKEGQIKKVIVPDIDGTEDAWVEFKYSENGKIRQSPTQVTYQYFNNTTSQYETASCSVSYDEAGRVVRTTDANNRILQMAYDVADAAGRSDIATYGTDIEAQIHSTCCTVDWLQDEDDRTINIGYDDAGRPTKAWNSALGQSGASPFIEAGYDSFGNTTTVKTRTDASAAARTSTYTYDDNDRPTSLTYPDGTIGMEECEYDSVDNTIWSKDGNSLFTLYHYDDLYRLTAVGHSTTRPQAPYDGVNPAPDISIGYYGNSDLIQSLADSTGITEFKYDERGRLVSYDPADHVAVIYTYDNLDQVKSITSGDYNVQYNYYANGLLKNVTTDSGTTILATYIYDPAGVAQEIQYGNGTKAEFGYTTGDARYPLESITYSNTGGTILSLDYTSRDKSGNPLSVTDSHLGTINYSPYDGMARLTGATYPAPVPGQPAGGVYGYDWVDNRLTPPGASPMLYNSVDQLTSWPGMYNYTYYSDGSLKEVRTPQGELVASYTYNSDGLLESATYGSTILSQDWDGMGNRVGLRIQKNGGAEQVWSFLYDPTAGVPAVLEEVGPDGVPVRYFRTPGGSLIARVKGSDWRYYHYDELGSTRLLTDATGNVTDEYIYDSYGSLISHTGTTQDNPYQWVGALGYYTHYQDPEFGLIQTGFRFYDTDTGRFTQQDPIGDGINWYAYAGGNPVGAVDPWGLAWYDGWLSGKWGSKIPVLGRLYERAGTAYGLWESGRGSGFRAAITGANAIGGTVIAGVGIFYGGRGALSLGRGLLTSGTSRIMQGSGGSGFVYALIRNGRIVYIGRTIDIVRRAAEQTRAYGDITVRTLAENLTYAEMRGLEQFFINQNGLANLWNRINGVALSNPRLPEYMDAAQKVICKH